MTKKLSRRLLVALVAAFACACLVLAGCSSSGSNSKSSSSSSDSSSSDSYKLVQDGTLKVATSPDYMPLEYRDGNNDITGFDIALIKEIGNRMGLNVEVQQQSFDTLVTQVSGGSNFDCAISAITITPEREDEVAFTDPYYDSNLAIVVLKDSGITSKDQITSVGAQSGSSGEDWVKENLSSADYTPFQETPDALASLRAGKVQAVVYDDPVAENHVSGEYSDCTILQTIPTGEQYGIIVNKDNKALADAMNEQLKAIQDDGTMDQLKKDYIDNAVAEGSN